jgi:hypothetical protein
VYLLGEWYIYFEAPIKKKSSMIHLDNGIRTVAD